MRNFFNSFLAALMTVSVVSAPALAGKKDKEPEVDPFLISQQLAALHLTLIPIRAVNPMSSEMYVPKVRENYPETPLFEIASDVFDGRGELLLSEGTEVLTYHKAQPRRRLGRKGKIHLCFKSAVTAQGKPLKIDGEFQVDGIAETGKLINKAVNPIIQGTLTGLVVFTATMGGIAAGGAIGAALAGGATTTAAVLAAAFTTNPAGWVALGALTLGIVLSLPFTLYLLKKGQAAIIEEGAVFQVAMPDPAFYPEGSPMPDLSSLLGGK